MDNPVLTTAFVVAATAFFKTQMKLEGRYALLCAFAVTAVVALLPLTAALLPSAASPFVLGLAQVVALFIGAAGSYDAVTGFIKVARAPRFPGK